MKKNISIILYLLFLFPLISVNSESVESFTDEAGHANDIMLSKKKQKVEYTTSINAIVAWPPQALVGLQQAFKLPFMNFDNPLLKDNNITFKLGADLSPLTLEGKFGIVWAPIAFLEFYAESKIGLGWSINNLYGTAINENIGGKTSLTPINFNRPVYSFSLGGAFQFDLAAVIPNDWTHIVFRTDQFAVYRAMGGVSSDTSWVYQADTGENRNGWQYGASYVVGYKMPIFLDFIAFRIENQKKFFASPSGLDKKIWGEDLLITIFGPLVNFNINKDYNIMLLSQWIALPNHKNTAAGTFYQERVLDDNKKLKVVFYQAGIIFNMNLNWHKKN